MSVISKSPRILLLLAMLTGTASASLAAQQQDPSDADISAAVYSSPSPEAAEMPKDLRSKASSPRAAATVCKSRPPTAPTQLLPSMMPPGDRKSTRLNSSH